MRTRRASRIDPALRRFERTGWEHRSSGLAVPVDPRVGKLIDIWGYLDKEPVQTALACEAFLCPLTETWPSATEEFRQEIAQYWARLRVLIRTSAERQAVVIAHAFQIDQQFRRSICHLTRHVLRGSEIRSTDSWQRRRWCQIRGGSGRTRSRRKRAADSVRVTCEHSTGESGRCLASSNLFGKARRTGRTSLLASAR